MTCIGSLGECCCKRAARRSHLTFSYMVCLDREDLYRTAEWDGAAGSSRRRLLERLQGELLSILSQQ